MGTADYVAPEQVMDSRSADGRADIYSLGLTFYFLLTGRRPFPKATLVELLMAHKMEKPEPIGKFASRRSAGLGGDCRADDGQEAVHAVSDRQGSGRDASQLAARIGERPRVFADFGPHGRGHAPKPTPPGDSAAAKPGPAGNADLELVFLDDERKSNRGPAEAKPSESSRSRIAAAAPKPKERKTSTGDSGPQRGVKLPDLLADDVISASSDPRLAVGVDQANLPYTGHPQFKRGKNANILKSPWPWIGAAGLIFVVLFFLILSLIPGSRDLPDNRRSTQEPVAPKLDVQAPAEAAEAARPKASDTGGTSSGGESINLNKLIAEIRTIAFDGHMDHPEEQGQLKQVVEEKVQETFNDLGLKGAPPNSNSNAMKLNLAVSKAGNSLNVVLSVTVNCIPQTVKPSRYGKVVNRSLPIQHRGRRRPQSSMPREWR